MRAHFDEDAYVMLRRFKAELAFWVPWQAPSGGNWSFHGEVLGSRLRVGCRWDSRPASVRSLTGVVSPAVGGGSELVGQIGVSRGARRLFGLFSILMVIWVAIQLLALVTWGHGPGLLREALRPITDAWLTILLQDALGVFLLWRRRRRNSQGHSTVDQALLALVAAIAEPGRRPAPVQVGAPQQ